MMPEEIRPASPDRPRRVCSLSREQREQREENRDRFTRELAELAGEPHGRDDGRPRRGRTRCAAPAPDQAETPADDAAPGDAPARGAIGRNLDVTT
jgi:hypothetical protein